MGKETSDLWALRGVEPRVREAFKKQARRRSIPVGILANAAFEKATELLKTGQWEPDARQALKRGPKTDPKQKKKHLEAQLSAVQAKLAALNH